MFSYSTILNCPQLIALLSLAGVHKAAKKTLFAQKIYVNFDNLLMYYVDCGWSLLLTENNASPKYPYLMI